MGRISIWGFPAESALTFVLEWLHLPAVNAASATTAVSNQEFIFGISAPSNVL
jgi:hypothetical protein